jgi:predicted phage terminase large subunit-like protein
VSNEQPIVISPQEGPQSDFLQCPADIAIYGGGAGGGKSFALLLDPLYQHDNPEFNGIIFRRSTTQIRNPGGLWDESLKLYSVIEGANPRQSILRWDFDGGPTMKFAHLEYDLTVYDYQGAQIPWIGFDELTHFTEKQFWYMMSRNRSTSGVPGRIRATTNPDVDSWVRTLIDWWIGEDGLPIKERSGVIRWFVRIDDKLVWADTKRELIETYGEGTMPKSFTFIPAVISDNKVLLEKDPSYLASLKALSKVERSRLLDGNWNIRAVSGMYFKSDWFSVIDAIPAGFTSVCRFWDRAATKPNPENKDPDWTRGVLLYKYPDGRWVVGDLRSLQDTPGQVEKLIKNTASFDGYSVAIGCQQDPGSAGVKEAQNFVTMLSGYDVRTITFSKSKETRAKAVSSQAEALNISVLRAPWNKEFFSELESFPEGSHDDIVDAFSGAFNQLNTDVSLFDTY